MRSDGHEEGIDLRMVGVQTTGKYEVLKPNRYIVVGFF